MRAELEVLLGNLRALKNEGSTEVFVSEEALEALRERVAAVLRDREEPGLGAVPAKKPTSEKNISAAPRGREVRQSFPEPDPVADAFPPISFDDIASKKSEANPIPAGPEKKTPDFDVGISKARVSAVPATGTNAERLAALREQMLGDPVCNEHLHKGKQLVFGEGNAEARVFFLRRSSRCGRRNGRAPVRRARRSAFG